MLFKVKLLVETKRAEQKAAEPEVSDIPTIRMPVMDSWKVKKLENGYKVTGRKIEKFASRTDFDNEHGIQRLRDIMRKMGIMNKLIKDGIKTGDMIIIGHHGEMEY